MVGNEKKHHGTVGSFVGHGITPVYYVKDNASFDYFRDGGKEDQLNIIIMSLIDQMVQKLERQLPGVVMTGNMITAMLEQKSPARWKEKFELSSTNKYKGMYSAWSCFSSYTKELHQDNDCSYTLIGVPANNYNNGVYCFQFAWGDQLQQKINFLLTPGIILYYPGYAIHHRQQEVEKKENFFNVACYHNCRFYRNINSSLKREEGEELMKTIDK